MLLLPFIWAGAGGSQDLVSKPTTGTGWEADLGRMGFEVPIEELNQGEIVGQKWLAGGECPGFLGAKVYFLAPVPPEKVARAILFFDPTQGKNLLWEDS
ncbi:MAG: hypothetical protein NTZ01_06740, partial [Verrucomicrobia bacterium]|nr:hypothetical protein [Verrucomicrobiota bacterium]